MTFAEKIKSLRKERGLTQMQLAAATNISLAVIAGVESGRRTPSKEMAIRLAEYFNLPVETFILENVEIERKPATTAQILLVADIVTEYLNKNGYTITPEQRAALVDHFYHANITNAEQIKQSLSVLAAMQFGQNPRK